MMAIRNEEVRKLRSVYRLTLRDMGALLDVSESHICRIEHGERVVTQEIAEKLTDELALTPEKLARILSMYDSLTEEVARGSTSERTYGFQPSFAT